MDDTNGLGDVTDIEADDGLVEGANSSRKSRGAILEDDSPTGDAEDPPQNWTSNLVVRLQGAGSE
eukprot:3846326-Amphidinium_carterae.1